jgi:DNA uptake protein ComE-like DNA-binding protein
MFIASLIAVIHGTRADNVNNINIQVSQSDDVTKININKGSVDELKSLPGIGETLANKIIDNRPYGSVYDLIRVDGIGDGKIQGLIGKVVW